MHAQNNQTPIHLETNTSNTHQFHQQKIIYISQHKDNKIFCSESLQLFNLYKRFVQNTIIQLGEDWRIESGLLAQEIMADKNLSNDQFCIFNEFMVVFLRNKLTQENYQQHGLTIITQEQGQQEFLMYFDKPHNNNPQNKYSVQQIIQQDISNSLTFKTLSLGFYITASDIWSRTFKKYYRQSIQEKLQNISFSLANNEKQFQYFATLDLRTQRWIIQQESNLNLNIESIQKGIQSQIHKSQQKLSRSIRLGSVIANITQFMGNIQKSSQRKNEQSMLNFNQDNKNIKKQYQSIKVRQFSLCRQFYLLLFSTWLIFSIKKSFNSNMFSQSCFIRYCDILITSKLFSSLRPSTISSSQSGNIFHPIYKQFKQLCDRQWKSLMEDYMVALNDDKQVIKALIKKIGDKIQLRFVKEIQIKKNKLNQR